MAEAFDAGDFGGGADLEVWAEVAGEAAIAVAVVPASFAGDGGAVWGGDGGVDGEEGVAAGLVDDGGEERVADGEVLGAVVDEETVDGAFGGAAAAAAAGFFEEDGGDAEFELETGGAGDAGETGADDSDARGGHECGTLVGARWTVGIGDGEVIAGGNEGIAERAGRVEGRRMHVTMIAAMDGERALSRGGRVPWHLPADVAMFRGYCEGKALLAGRRTWEQMRGWFRAGQLPLVLTRREGLEVPGGRAVGSVGEALRETWVRGYGELVVIGGGETYGAALGVAGQLILTEVRGKVGGDVFFPALDPCEWEVKDEVDHAADEAHEFAFTIRRYERRAIEPTDEPL